MHLYSDLIAKTFIPDFNISYLLLLSSLLYLIYNRQIIGYITIFLAIAIFISGTTSEAYYQQVLPLIIICVGVFLSHFLNSTRNIIIFVVTFTVFSISYLYKTNFMTGVSGYGITLSDKIDLVKKVGYYPQYFKVIAPGQEFSSITAPYEYLFWYHYKTKKPDTFVVLNEYLLMVE